MNRLTHARMSGIKTGYWSPANKEELIQRLAAYENTGLEPEECGTITLKGAIDFLNKIGWLPDHDRELTIGRWTPGDGSLPDPDVDVLCFIDAGTFQYFDVLWIDETSKQWADGEDFHFKVVAWMPIPGPYPEEGNEGENDAEIL